MTVETVDGNPRIAFDLFYRLARQYPELGVSFMEGEDPSVNWSLPVRGTLSLKYRSCGCCTGRLEEKNRRAERKLIGHLLEGVELLGMEATLETGARAKLFLIQDGALLSLTDFCSGDGPLALEVALLSALLAATPAYRRLRHV